MKDSAEQDWPGRAEGVPPPPTQAQVDEVSEQQHLITDEWAPQPAPVTDQKEGIAAPEVANR